MFKESVRIRNSWDKKAKNWHNYLKKGEDLFRKHITDQLMIEQVDNILSVKKNIRANILDVGCGDGSMSKLLSNICSNSTISGVDISENLIKIARKSYPDISFNVDDASLLRIIKSNSIDIIVTNNVLMDLSDLDGAVKNFYRVLKSGGDILILMLHPCFPLYKFKKLQDYYTEKLYAIPSFIDTVSDDFLINHRPLSRYFSVFFKNKFVIKQFTEPRLEKYTELFNSETLGMLCSPYLVFIHLQKSE